MVLGLSKQVNFTALMPGLILEINEVVGQNKSERK
jgi:hypothetical protein